MKQILSKVILSFLALFSSLIFAQGIPTPPETPQGPVPGAPDETPIDMYIVYLAVIAVGMIIFYANKKRKIA